MNDAPSPAPSLEREHVTVGERDFMIERPTQTDRLKIGDEPPYWTALWPAARMLAQASIDETWTPETEALEIGCGLGLPGIVALSAGIRVTFSDLDPVALQFAAHNARLNGYSHFQTLKLDWRFPPPDLKTTVLLASDLVYELQSVEPVVQCIKTLLAPGGLCLLTQMERLPSPALRRALEASGLAVEARTKREIGPEGKRVKGTLYHLRQ